MRQWLIATLFALAVVPANAQEAVEQGTGAILRGLDKVSGDVTDLTLANGESAPLGLISLQLGECRFPEGDTVRDAFAFVTIREADTAHVLFSGWMIASAPALNALEHARYDVWVLRCTGESKVVPEESGTETSDEIQPSGVIE